MMAAPPAQVPEFYERLPINLKLLLAALTRCSSEEFLTGSNLDPIQVAQVTEKLVDFLHVS